MCWWRLRELLFDPVTAIMHAKREKNLNMTLQILIIEWVVIAVAVAINPAFAGVAKAAATAFTALIGIVATLFIGFLVQLIFEILGGKGHYYAGLTSKVYAIFPIAVGFLLANIFIFIPIVGLPIAVIAAIIFTLIGLVTFYRTIKELFAVDIITAWIGISILILGLVVGFYLAILPFVGSLTTDGFPFFSMMGR